MQREMIVRICAVCEKPLNFRQDGTQRGVYCDGSYYHQDDCLEKSFEGEVNEDGTPMTWESHYTEDGDCYYTEWEPEFVEEIK
jgi:hypothetical protein